jgi:AraC-like DNA-binding protein
MPVLELDTASLNGPERFSVWAETIATAFGPFGISRNDPDRFHGRVRVERRHAIRFIELAYEGHAFRRSRSDVARLDDAYCSLLRPLQGRLILLQDGVEHVLEPGQYYLVNHAVPYETVPQAGYQAVALAFPPSALASRVANPRSFYALKDDPASPRWALLDGFLAQYTAGRQLWTETEFDQLTQQLLDLIVMSIVEPGQHASATECSVQAAHRSRALRHIRAHLPDRDLNPPSVARACGISLAYLHELFRDAGSRAEATSVEATIFAERLERASMLLRAPDHAGLHIATIAYRLGFSDPAHFARAFRRRFGASPTEWRSNMSPAE